jgi:hypothetical protein
VGKRDGGACGRCDLGGGVFADQVKIMVMTGKVIVSVVRRQSRLSRFVRFE